MKTSLLSLSFLCLVSNLAAADAPAAASASASAKPAASAASATAADSGPYHKLDEIDIGGGLSWDYLAVDSAAHRLYVSHSNSFAVVDLDQDKKVGEITDLNRVHGIAIVPKTGMGYISNGGNNTVTEVDLKTLEKKRSFATGTNPDWIMYEPSQNEIYAFNGRSQSASVINLDSGNVSTIPLGGKPETAMLDPKAGQIYDNLEDKFAVAVIDIKTHAVLPKTWSAVAGKGGSGMAIDTEHHRIFLGCEDTIAMMDATNGKVLATLPAAPGIDAASFDPGTQYVFVSGSTNGGVTIAKVDGDKLTLVQNLTTVKGAHTMALDPTTHKIYVPASSNGFKILVYGMDAKVPATADTKK